jgi:hypothetical protein
MATYYAWTRFEAERNDWGVATKIINPGDAVTASDLGVNKEEFDEYIDSGAVRTDKYPDMGNFDGSPTEFARRELARAARGDESFFAPGDDEAEPTKATDAKK